MIPIPFPLSTGVAILVVSVLTSSALSGWKFWNMGVEHARNQQLIEDAKQTKREMVSIGEALNLNQESVKSLNETLTKIKSTKTIDRGVIEREIRTDVRYVNVCLPDNGLRIWNSISKGDQLMPNGGSGLKLDKAMSAGNVTTTQ